MSFATNEPTQQVVVPRQGSPRVDAMRDTVNTGGTRSTTDTSHTPVVQAQESPRVATKHPFAETSHTSVSQTQESRLTTRHSFAPASDTPHTSSSQAQESPRITARHPFALLAAKDSTIRSTATNPPIVSPLVLTARSSTTRQSDTMPGAGLPGSGQLGPSAGQLGENLPTPLAQALNLQVKAADGLSLFGMPYYFFISKQKRNCN
jgi:hypothetical protein